MDLSCLIFMFFIILHFRANPNLISHVCLKKINKFIATKLGSFLSELVTCGTSKRIYVRGEISNGQSRKVSLHIKYLFSTCYIET